MLFLHQLALAAVTAFSVVLTPVAGYYHGGEIHTKAGHFDEGECTKVQWRARPAVGNCVISLMSIFNADLIYGGGSPPAWSEVTFETFGGSANNNAKTYQTQYISQETPGATRKQHVEEETTDIFDGHFHTFEIEFCPAENGSGAWARWKLDGSTLRTESEGDLNDLVPPLDIYAGAWVARTNNGWACTSDDSRPNQSEMAIDWIKVTGGSTESWYFDSNDELNDDWTKSYWDFNHFDGIYSPSNAYVTSGNGRAIMKVTDV